MLGRSKQGFFRAPLGKVHDARTLRTIQVGHHGGKPIAASERLLIDADTPGNLTLASRHPPGDGASQDAVSFLPGDALNLGRSNTSMCCRMSIASRSNSRVKRDRGSATERAPA